MSTSSLVLGLYQRPYRKYRVVVYINDDVSGCHSAQFSMQHFSEPPTSTSKRIYAQAFDFVLLCTPAFTQLSNAGHISFTPLQFNFPPINSMGLLSE